MFANCLVSSNVWYVGSLVLGQKYDVRNVQSSTQIGKNIQLQFIIFVDQIQLEHAQEKGRNGKDNSFLSRDDNGSVALLSHNTLK